MSAYVESWKNLEDLKDLHDSVLTGVQAKGTLQAAGAKVDVVNFFPNEVLGRAYGPTVQHRSLLATGTLTHRQHLPRGPEQTPIPRALS